MDSSLIDLDTIVQVCGLHGPRLSAKKKSSPQKSAKSCPSPRHTNYNTFNIRSCSVFNHNAPRGATTRTSLHCPPNSYTSTVLQENDLNSSDTGRRPPSNKKPPSRTLLCQHIVPGQDWGQIAFCRRISKRFFHWVHLHSQTEFFEFRVNELEHVIVSRRVKMQSVR